MPPTRSIPTHLTVNPLIHHPCIHIQPHPNLPPRCCAPWRGGRGTRPGPRCRPTWPAPWRTRGRRSCATAVTEGEGRCVWMRGRVCVCEIVCMYERESVCVTAGWRGGGWGKGEREVCVWMRERECVCVSRREEDAVCRRSVGGDGRRGGDGAPCSCVVVGDGLVIRVVPCSGPTRSTPGRARSRSRGGTPVWSAVAVVVGAERDPTGRQSL